MWPTGLSMPCGSDSAKASRLAPAQRLHDAVAVDLGAEGDVGGHAVVEQDHLLADQGELLAQGLQVPVRQCHAIEHDATAAGLEEARQQVDQRRLAGAGGADQRDGLPGPDLEAHVVERGRLLALVLQAHALERDCADCAAGRMAAAVLDRRVVGQRQPALHRGQSARDRAGHLGQVLERRDQRQHRRHVGHEGADRAALAAALPERDDDHRRQRAGRQQLRDRRHHRGRDRGLQRQPAQLVAGAHEALQLPRGGVVQPHQAPREHVLLDHVGQFVGGLLAGHRDPVHALAEDLHDPGHGREQDRDEQRQRPVDPEQVAHQRDHREAVLEQGLHRADQHRGP